METKKFSCVPVRKNNKCPSGWKILEQFSKGGNANIYSSCCNDNCKYVAKHIVIQSGNNIEKEVELQMLTSNENLAPKIVDFWKCKHGGVIIMEISKISAEILIEKLYNTNANASIYPLILNIIKAYMKLKKRYMSWRSSFVKYND